MAKTLWTKTIGGVRKLLTVAGGTKLMASEECCCCSRQARSCANDALADVWMTCADAESIGDGVVFQFVERGPCFYFNFADETGAPSGTLKTAGDVFATRTDCDDSDCCQCYEVLSCDDDSLAPFSIDMSGRTAPFYFGYHGACWYVPEAADLSDAPPVEPEQEYADCDDCLATVGCCQVVGGGPACVSISSCCIITFTVVSPPTGADIGSFGGTACVKTACSGWTVFGALGSGLTAAGGLAYNGSNFEWGGSGSYRNSTTNAHIISISSLPDAANPVDIFNYSGDMTCGFTDSTTGGTNLGTGTVHFEMSVVYTYCCWDGAACVDAPSGASPDGSCPAERGI